MPNTEIRYSYSDAGNYTQHETVVLEGKIAADDLEIILSKCIDREFFIPEQVGLCALQDSFGKLNLDDHPYHRLDRDNIRFVDEAPTLVMKAVNFVDNFKRVVWDLTQADKDLRNR